MNDLGATTPKRDNSRGFLDRFGDWLIGRFGRKADSTLSQVSYVIRLQFWPIFFTAFWIIICCVPDQVVEYYSALVQSARASNPLARSGLVVLVTSGFWVSSTIFASAFALVILPGPMHLGATRKTAARLSLLLPFALLVASLLAVPMGMLQPRAWRTLETDDYRTFTLVLLGYLAASVLAGFLVMFALRRGRLASSAFAIVGSRARRGVAGAALVALIAAPLAVAFIMMPVLGQLAGKGVADITDEQPLLSYPEFGLFSWLAGFIVALTVTLTSLSYLFRNLIGFPLIAVLFAVAAINAAFDLNDNHKIRETKLTIPTQRPEYPVAFSAWLCSRWDLENFIERPQTCPQTNSENGLERSNRPAAAGGTYPVYVVAAQGGGIYAAYEASMFLARMEDECPGFSQHVFFISAVSGGSLGAAAFSAATVRNSQTRHVECTGRQGARVSDLMERFLRNDFLSPTAGAALTSNFLQLFWPRPVASWDRARAMEAAIDFNWWRAMKAVPDEAPDDGDPIATSRNTVHKLFFVTSELNYWTPFFANPAIVFNTTEVESGQTVAIAPFDKLYNYTGVSGLHDVNATLSMPVSTAVSLSSRFPYLAPAGWFEGDKNHPSFGRRHLVDGAYVENSGIQTAMRLVAPLEDMIKKGRLPVKLVLIALAGPFQNEPPSIAFGELMAPIRTLLATRGARGRDAEIFAAHDLNEGRLGPQERFRRVTMDVGRHVLPLGWVMSDISRQMIARAVGIPECDADKRALAVKDAVEVASTPEERQARHQAMADCVMAEIKAELSLASAPTKAHSEVP
jgi:hypothetical protein